ncbi:hypothetical protein PDL04_25490 [Bacillus cereus group sp. BY142LC]|uniref:hypothetical protein n=1 Tax=Bacillus cereus group sp. BY142LC TaxID=3018083 RepID=UPI0022E4B8E4|nr:hypothetical protein [Bacillus cereus group sp. BY142LC]MDA1834815.1 hypothetical protein [Bacillus cereus group sp. BY142LC]
MKENSVKLNNVIGWMIFNIVTMDDSFVEEIEVSCGEDIESFMKMYLDENWNGLFEMKSYIRDVCDASFQGIQLKASDTEEKHVCYVDLLNGARRSSVVIDRKVLGDINADKIKSIREIINS